MRVIIHHGLPDHLRHDAARLYWQAFGGKLGRVLGPERLAFALLVAAAIVAVPYHWAVTHPQDSLASVHKFYQDDPVAVT